jgi:hypothetical protein
MARSDAKKASAGTMASTTSSRSSTPEYQRMVAEAAYYRALGRGFQGGDPVDDWIQAEKEIGRTLKSKTDH